MTPLLISALAISSPLYYEPNQFPGEGAAQVQACFDTAIRDKKNVDLSRCTGWVGDVIVESKNPKDSFVTIEVIGHPEFSSLNLDRGRLVFREGKRCCIRRVAFYDPDPSTPSEGLVFEAKQSSSSLVVEQCTFQGFKTGLAFRGADNNSDISVVSVRDCAITYCTTGVLFEGSNVLDPLLENLKMSNCVRGVDARKGGSNMTAIACGGSFTDTLFDMNGGFSFNIDIQSCELGTTLVKYGGDDAAGYGQVSNRVVTVQDARDCSKPFIFYGAGTTWLRILNCNRIGSLMAENRHQTETAKMYLQTGSAKLLTSSKGKVSFSVQ